MTGGLLLPAAFVPLYYSVKAAHYKRRGNLALAELSGKSSLYCMKALLLFAILAPFVFLILAILIYSA